MDYFYCLNPECARTRPIPGSISRVPQFWAYSKRQKCPYCGESGIDFDKETEE